ncbi:MAG TPA: CvpA family protein [Tepidisphaeraceae bacterium]|jgi:hypothetical protein
MILSVVVILIVGLIAYIHYVGGLISGLISGILAVLAAMMALSFYEPMANYLSGGKFSDQAQAICLIAIFALVYLIGRVFFDSLVPGNIRLPHLVDSIGGAVCGLIAGIFATGIVVIALQSMPFGPSIFGYSRYELRTEREREVVVPGEGTRQVNRTVYDEMKNADLEKDERGLILPVDDIVVATAKRLSGAGSLANEKPFDSIHPDLIQELFGQRVGIESGGKHTATNKTGTQVEVVQATVLMPPTLPKAMAEFTGIRDAFPKGEKLAPEAGKKLVAVTVLFKNDAADEVDHLVRLSTGSVRIVTKTADGGWKDNYPVGTFQQGQVWINKPDDFLFIDVSKEDHGAHFVFELDDTDSVFNTIAGRPAVKGAQAAPESVQFVPGTFIEIKRLVKVPLDDVKVVVGQPPAGKKFFPLRKAQLYKEDPNAPAEQPQPEQPQPQPTANAGDRTANTMSALRGRRDAINAATADNPGTRTPATAAPGTATEENGWKTAHLDQPTLTVTNKLPYALGVGTGDADADVATTAVSGHLTGKKFDVLETDLSSPDSVIANLGKSPPTVQELFVPQGKRMVQVTLKTVAAAGEDPWAWATLGPQNTTVVDGRNIPTKPSGIYYNVKQGGAEKLMATYRANVEGVNVSPIQGATVDSITLIFLMEADQRAKELQFLGKANGFPLKD